MIGFVILPLIDVVRYSFTRWDGISDPRPVGADNFRYLLDSPSFHRVLLNNVVLIGGIAVWVLVPFALAITLFGRRHANLVRAILFIPVLLPPIVAGTVFRLFLADDGPVNTALRAVHLDPLAHDWLQDPNLVLVSVIAVIAWATMGTGVLLYTAALSQIPTSLLEAARIDGAGRRQLIRHVYRPSLRPVSKFWVILLIVTTVNGVFPWIYGLTLGGPGVASTTIDFHVYQNGIVGGAYGLGSAVAVIGLGFTVVLFGLRAILRLSIDRIEAARRRVPVRAAMGIEVDATPPAASTHRRRSKLDKLGPIGGALRGALVVGAALAAILPLMWVVRVATRGVVAFEGDPSRIADGVTFDNFRVAWKEGGLGRGLWITLLTVPIGAALATVVAALAGYALAKLDIPGKRIIAALTVIGIAVPIPAIIIPLFDRGLEVGYSDNLPGLVLVYGALFASWGTYFLYRHFSELPNELIDSARVDGAGPMRVLWSMVMPLSWPAITSVLVLNVFIASSNLILPLVMLTSPGSKPAIVRLAVYNGQYRAGGPLSAAGAIITAVPIILVYLAGQRAMRSNVLAGSVKG